MRNLGLAGYAIGEERTSPRLVEAIAAIVSQVNPRLGSNRAGSKNANANANVNVGGAGCAGLLFVFPNMLVCCSFDWGNLGNLGNLVLGEGDCSWRVFH